jgi:hypothetical protein
MAGSRDSSDISPSNIIEPTWETLPADEQLQFEEHKEQLIQEAKEKLLANFKVDRNNKVVRQRATDLASLRPITDTPNVSNTNELQSLKAYKDEQREQMQHIVGGIQKDYKRLVHAFDKSTVANFPSHEVELGENTRNSSAIGCHDQSQPLYGMPMDKYPEQPQIGSKLADLHMSKPFAHERGPSGPATIGPIFNELPRYASKLSHVTQALNHPDRLSAYDHGWSAYPTGRSTYLTRWFCTGMFEEDCYLNPHPSHQHFPSQYTMHQPINTTSQTREGEYFLALSKRLERNGQSYEPYRVNSSAPQNSN